MLKSLAESLTGLTKLFDINCIGYKINLLGCAMMYKSGRLILLVKSLFQYYELNILVELYHPMFCTVIKEVWYGH